MIQIFVAMLGGVCSREAGQLQLWSDSSPYHLNFTNYIFILLRVYSKLFVCQNLDQESINQSILRLFEKKPLLTQTQEGCTIELKNRKTSPESPEKSFKKAID